MSLYDFSIYSCITEKELKGIFEGKIEITPKYAAVFEIVLETPASFWINLEKNYRDSLKRLGK